ncbi:hypothetical protein ASG29_05860 [Sphingomonas sp. Leaf412]|uniref:EF-hand domain-containing protein n=1 Tax=Sphingomonas sp. Leaf412 TaxID=1736370 RepID=UPI0006F856F7|nr:EF-hand domain-containing protein [Sphingomonas sp. Leaf412]KQT33557.1 hypothetical protein ASG29_05860 [Sphingomonas sp. Leaf412]
MKKFLLAALAVSVAGGAVAQTPPPPPGGPKHAMPTTRAEAIAAADQRFAAMDTNRDGKVSGDERRAYREAKRERRAERDVTQAQFRDQAQKRFDRIDTNKDGTISAQEREAAKLLMRARMGGHRGHGGPAGA